jgi:hypothetical protein
LQEEFGPEVLALLGTRGGSPAKLAGGLILASALCLELSGPFAPSPDRLAAALSAACAAHDRRTVITLLSRIDERGATAGVLACLEATALAGRVHEVAELSRFPEGGAWLAHRDVRRNPALRVILAATDPRGPRKRGFELFRDVWGTELDIADPGLPAVLSALCWPLGLELLPVHEAISLGDLLTAEVLRATGFDGRLRAVFERCLRELGPESLRETAELAVVIRERAVELGEKSSAAADLLVRFGSGVTASMIVELELSRSDSRIAPTVRETILGELSGRLARVTADLTLPDPVHAARCFYVWVELADSVTQSVRDEAERLIGLMIVPALLQADRAWAATVGGCFGASERVAKRWADLATAHTRAE